MFAGHWDPRRHLAPVRAALVPLLLFAACGAPSEKSAVGATALSAEVRAARQLQEQGRFDEAVQAYDAALRKNRRDAPALGDLVALLLRQHRIEEARQRAEEVLREAPDAWAGHTALARVAYQQGNAEDAVSHLERARVLHPPDPAFYTTAATLYHAMARSGRGIELLKEARTRGLADVEILSLMGDLYSELALPREAAEAFREALQKSPDSPDLQRNLGRVLLMLNRRSEAEEAFRAALRLRPEDPYALYYLGTLHLERGEAKEAVGFLTRSLQKDERNPKARYALAQALLKLGRKKEAEAEFARHARLMERLYHQTPAVAGGNAAAGRSTSGMAFAVEEGAGGNGVPSAPPAVPGSSPAGDRTASRFWFVDVAEQAGIVLRNVSGGPDKDYIIESLGSGACWLDYDGDGRLDLYLVNGRRLPPAKEDAARDALYRNQGDGSFVDVTGRAGLRDTGWGHGCAVGDIDNDGDPDLYVANRGTNALYLNNGNGTFREVAKSAGVDDPDWSTSVAFADYDGDGFLDLAVANYVDFDPANTPRPGSGDLCRFLGMPGFCGPRGLPAARNRLYRNRGNGTFEDVTASAGFHTDRGYYSLGLVWGDVDGDGHPDLYVATDSTPKLLYRNNGNGTFTDVAREAGVAYNDEGREQAGMGADMADYDNDGDLDIIVTNFSHDVNTLHRQDAPWVFTDVSYPSGIGAPSLLYLGWGVGLVDLDNDGWKDLFVTNGHVYPQIDRHDLASRYRERNLLFQNRRDGTFEEVGEKAGPGMALELPGRATAFADYDDDGDLDVLVNNIDEKPTLLRNENGNRSHWIGLKLVGRRCNRDAVGARVTLKTREGIQMAEVHPGYSYLASSDPRLLFGLGPGPVTRSGEIQIRWPDGLLQTVRDLPVDCYHSITEPQP